MIYKFKMERMAGKWGIQAWDKEGKLLLQSDQVLTAKQVAISLGKSRRHVYRYMKVGILTPLGKFLGEWLFDGEMAKRFKWAQQKGPIPLKRLHLPNTFQVLFPEYDLSTLNPWTNAPVVICRLLDSASRKAWQWTFSHFPRSLIKEVVFNHGKRRLSPRAHHFFTWLLSTPL